MGLTVSFGGSDMDGWRARIALRLLVAAAALAASVSAVSADPLPFDESDADYYAQAPSSTGGSGTAGQALQPDNPTGKTSRQAGKPDLREPPVTQPPTTSSSSSASSTTTNPYAGLFVNPAERRSYSLASTPNMLGDVLGVKYMVRGGGSLALAGGDRGAKVADDSRPIPTDRVFFDYNHFDNANLTANGASIGLNRYTVGVEKTFFDCWASIEIKAPIDYGLNRLQTATATTADNEGTVFGNLSITPKLLLYQTCDWAVAAGVLFDLPTAPDVQYRITPVSQIETIVQNDAVFIQPFLGIQYAPNDRLFSITYLELDTDANGNLVLSPQGLPPGRMRYPTLLYVDWSAGYWLFHDDCCDSCDGCRQRWLTGVAPVIEIHYTTALENARGADGVFPVRQRVDILDLTAGTHFQFGRCSTLAVACCVPLRTSVRDKEFSTELLVELNRRF